MRWPHSKTRLVASPSLAHVPAAADVAPIDVELDFVKDPAQVRGVGSLALGCVSVLRRTVAAEVTRGGQRLHRGGTTVPALRHGVSLPECARPARYDRSVEDAAPAVLERTVVETEEGDHERFTHIVLEGFHVGVDDFVKAGNSVVEGMITSTPIVALCGKVWVPGKDPTRYPVCPSCKEIAAARGWRVPGA